MNLMIYNSEINFQQYVMFRTVKEVPTNVEMLVFYGTDYASQLSINMEVSYH